MRQKARKQNNGDWKLLRFFASDGFGLSLLFLIILVLIVATLLKPETAREYVYTNSFFFLLWGVLSLSLLSALLFRFRFRFKSLGSILTHACIVLILIGGAASVFWGERGFMELEEGNSSNIFYDEKDQARILPFEVALKDFSIEYYPETLERLWVQIPERRFQKAFPVTPGRPIPLQGTGYQLEVLRYEPDSVIDHKTERGPGGLNRPESHALWVKVTGPNGSNHRRVLANAPRLQTTDPPGDVELIYQRTPHIKEFQSTVEIRKGDQILRTGRIEVNDPLKNTGYLLYQSGYDEENPRRTVLEVVRDPGVPIVYTGFIFLIAGLSFVFFIKPNVRDFRENGNLCLRY
ncbi:MAG: hypothetical protein A3C36_05950 [Omnitrophica WOR_2 bacterium RIFCSPHIGHO2_02_FULL_52_10]|nr:MAG: hypothetical protein A3C36_05950 [Omnitrophica WOR_2 bacterium RIFCSPHIGHO2_02_FULL_52_10]